MVMMILSGVSAVVPTLFGMAWKGSLLVCGLLLAGRRARGASAATRHLLWTCGMVALLGLPVIDAAISWRVTILPSVTEAVALAASMPLTDGQGTAVSAAEPIGTSRTAARNNTITGFFGSLVWLLWMAGVIVAGVRLLAGWRAARAMVGRSECLAGGVWPRELTEAGAPLGVNHPVSLVKSREAELPFTVGVAHPIVVLPPSCERWPAARRRAVLLHELAHVRRRDVAVHMLAQMACAVHWFNPLVWLAARRLRAESERACDDLVLESGVRASGYAADLLEIVRAAAPSRAPAGAVAMAQSSEFEGRLLAILRPTALRRPPSRSAAWAILAGVAVAAFPLAALEPGVTLAVSGSGSVQDATLHVQSDTTAIVTLLRVLDEDALPAVRAAAARSLGEIGDPVAWQGLSRAVLDPAPNVRAAAVWALQVLDDERALPAFVRALGDESVTVRRIAARGIGGLAPATAPPELLAATGDPDETVRRMALWALGEIR